MNQVINYNEFTISYIEAIAKHLKIETDSTGQAIFVSSRIKSNDLAELKTELDELWPKAAQSVQIVQQKQESQLQSCLFGLVNDLDLALKTGYLISDRVVLIDYLYERILRKKKPEEISLQQVGVIASGLCNALELAKEGRLVIIPHPFGWHPETKAFIAEISEKVMLDPASMSLLSTLAIARLCQFQPYTIAESDQIYNQITGEQFDVLTAAKSATASIAFQSILGALLSEKLLTETDFSIVTDVPLSQYAKVISENRTFYPRFMERITNGGLPYSDINVETLSKNLRAAIIDNDIKLLKKFNTTSGSVASIAGAAITLASVAHPVAAAVKALGALLGLGGRLSNLAKFESSEDKIIIAVFRNLYKAV